jgi:hypothetical protein
VQLFASGMAEPALPLEGAPPAHAEPACGSLLRHAVTPTFLWKLAAQLQVLVDLREAAAIVTCSFGAAGRPPWPAIVVLNEVLQRSEAKR